MRDRETATSTNLSFNVSSRSVFAAWNSATHSAVLLVSEKGRRMGTMWGGLSFVLSMWFRNQSPDGTGTLSRASSLRFLHTRGGPHMPQVNLWG